MSDAAEAPSAVHVRTLALDNGWRPQKIGESALGLPIVAWWPGDRTPTRVVWAAVHGEEMHTLMLAHQLLRTIPAEDACAVVVPVLNPDGVMHGTRQNANGVDLNRNFPASSWSSKLSPTYWPTTLTRTREKRNQWSSPGATAGSEPETQAIMRLVERVAPKAVIDIHAPLECVIAMSERGAALGAHLAEPANLPVLTELEAPTPGDSATWVEENTFAATATYEIELAPFPLVWHRHKTALARAITDQLSLT